MTGEGCEAFVSDCQVRAAVELVDHAWDPVVLSALRRGPTRRNDLLAGINGVSDKVLTQALRRLLARGLVSRSREAGTGTVYRLSVLGESFASGPLAHLARWAAEHQAELAELPTPPS